MAIIRSIIGESPEQKLYREKLDEAQRIYKIGWQYKSKSDLENCIDACRRLQSAHAPNVMMVFARNRQIVMAYIKLVAIAVLAYRKSLGELAEQYDTVKAYNIEALEVLSEEGDSGVAGVDVELSEAMLLQASKKNDRDIEQLEEQRRELKVVTEETKMKIDSVKLFYSRLQGAEQKVNQSVETLAKKMLKYFEKAKEQEGVTGEERVRGELLLKGNWSDLKKQQEELQRITDTYAKKFNRETKKDGADSQSGEAV